MIKCSIGNEISTYKDMVKRWSKHEELLVNIKSQLKVYNNPSRITSESVYKRHLASLYQRSLKIQNRKVKEQNGIFLKRLNKVKSTIDFKAFEQNRKKQLKIIETGARYTKHRCPIRFQFVNSPDKYRHLHYRTPIQLPEPKVILNRVKNQNLKRVRLKYTDLLKQQAKPTAQRQATTVKRKKIVQVVNEASEVSVKRSKLDHKDDVAGFEYPKRKRLFKRGRYTSRVVNTSHNNEENSYLTAEDESVNLQSYTQCQDI